MGLQHRSENKQMLLGLELGYAKLTKPRINDVIEKKRIDDVIVTYTHTHTHKQTTHNVPLPNNGKRTASTTDGNNGGRLVDDVGRLV